MGEREAKVKRRQRPGERDARRASCRVKDERGMGATPAKAPSPDSRGDPCRGRSGTPAGGYFMHGGFVKSVGLEKRRAAIPGAAFANEPTYGVDGGGHAV